MEIIIATMPLWVAIVMLVVLQRPSQQAGLATLIAAIGSTLLFPVFRLFPGQLLLALVKGLATSLSVFYVLFPSLLLYYLLKSVNGMSLLGRGIARLDSWGKYIWVAPWLAALGGWITGSNTASNALLSQLQQEVSIQSGLPLQWLMGAQNGASAHATMISPARAIIAATAVGWSGAEVFLLRQMGLVVLGAVAVIMSLLVLAVS